MDKRYEDALPPQRDDASVLVAVREHDTIPPQTRVCTLEVFRGDPLRAPLTDDERALNEAWRKFGEVTLPDGTYYRELDPAATIRQVPAVVGRVIDEPLGVDEIMDLLGLDAEPILTASNLVVTTGKNLLLDRLYAMGGPPGALTAMGVGNSATAAVVGDTQLGGSSPAPDLRLFDSLPTRSGLVVTAIRTYATGEGNMNWQEIAEFNGTTNGTSTMFNRIAPIGAFNKTSAVAIQATMTVTQT